MMGLKGEAAIRAAAIRRAPEADAGHRAVHEFQARAGTRMISWRIEADGSPRDGQSRERNVAPNGRGPAARMAAVVQVRTQLWRMPK